MAAAPWFAPAGGIAVCLSPTALAAVPAWVQGRSAAAWWALGAVGLLAIASGGAWLTGNRGVFVFTWRPAPWVHLGWAALPLVIVGLREIRRDPGPWFALLPLLLAPSDVPAHLIAVPLFAERARTRGVVNGLLALHLAIGAVGMGLGVQRVAREAAVIERVAQQVDPHDAIEASWSLGVRASLAVTGRPDGLLQRSDPRYCARIPARLWRIADGAVVAVADPGAGCTSGARRDPLLP